MKYYLNLIKRKRIKEVLTYIAVTLLCFIFFIGGIKSKNSDGIIVSIFSLIFMYMACVYTPMTNPNAQDDSDFEVKSIGDEIYIKYKNYEYLLGKENFRVRDLFFKDKNGKIVRIITGYQIYHYVIYKYKHLLEREIDKNKIVNNKNIISRLEGLREITTEEKKLLIKQKKLKNIGNKFAKGLAFFSWFMALSMLSGVSEQPYMVICILFWVLGIGFAWFGIQMYKVGDKDNILIEKILKHKVYVIECYVYDKKRIPRGRYMIPHIKVKDDNDNYIDYWFEIPDQDYKLIDEMGGLKVKLYVIEDEPENKMIILSPFEEKTNG